MENISQFPVNWVDGMKISKREFIALENYLLDQVRDSNSLALTDYNFGLLPAPETGREPLSVDVSFERVELHYCRAVTRAGARIEIVDLTDGPLRRSVRELMGGFDINHSQEWYVMVRVAPFRVPDGKPSADTGQMLQTVPRYELAIIPKDQTNPSKIAAYAIPIAKIKGSVGGIEQVKNYLPPCARLNSSPELLRIHQRMEQELSAILKEATIIVRKVNYRRSRENVNLLAVDICQVASQTMEFLNNNYDAYRLLIPHQSPLLLIEYFARFARSVDTSLELTRGKDDMLNYFQQYVQSFRFAEFNAAVQALTSSLIYNHLELRTALDRVENFVGQIKNLLEGLGRLNYEQLPRYDPVLGTRNLNEQQSYPPRNQQEQQPYPPPQQQAKPGLKIKGKDQGGGYEDHTTPDSDNPFGLK